MPTQLVYYAEPQGRRLMDVEANEVFVFREQLPTSGSQTRVDVHKTDPGTWMRVAHAEPTVEPGVGRKDLIVLNDKNAPCLQWATSVTRVYVVAKFC